MKLAGIVLTVLIYTLLVLVVGVQFGLHQRIAPVTLHARCDPPPLCFGTKGIVTCDPHESPDKEVCYFTDDAGRTMQIRVRDGEAQPYYPKTSSLVRVLPSGAVVYATPCPEHRADLVYIDPCTIHRNEWSAP